MASDAGIVEAVKKEKEALRAALRKKTSCCEIEARIDSIIFMLKKEREATKAAFPQYFDTV